MNNLEAVKALCNAIANTFYPDDAVVHLMLNNEGMDADADATPRDANIFRIAVALVYGYVEGSRTEGGVSTSVRAEAIKDSIKYWCGVYGLDAEDYLNDSVSVLQDGSGLW